MWKGYYNTTTREGGSLYLSWLVHSTLSMDFLPNNNRKASTHMYVLNLLPPLHLGLHNVHVHLRLNLLSIVASISIFISIHLYLHLNLVLNASLFQALRSWGNEGRLYLMTSCHVTHQRNRAMVNWPLKSFALEWKQLTNLRSLFESVFFHLVIAFTDTIVPFPVQSLLELSRKTSCL